MKRNMPAFSGINCKEKFFLFLFGVIAIYSLIVHKTMVTIGLYAGVIIMVLLLLSLLLIVDRYGDFIFTDPKYLISKDEMKNLGMKEIVYSDEKATIN